MRNIKPYKQHGMTYAISCMLMVLEYYKIIPKASYLYEQKYFKSYRSKYTLGTPFSALAWHFSKNGLKTELIHSEKEIFINSIYDEDTFNSLMNEYKSYMNDAINKGCIVRNGIDINYDLLKQNLDNDKLIILAGQVNGILHAILLIGYENDKFIVCDPLYKQKQIMSLDEINNFMNIPIGKWCIIVSN